MSIAPAGYRHGTGGRRGAASSRATAGGERDRWWFGWSSRDSRASGGSRRPAGV